MYLCIAICVVIIVNEGCKLFVLQLIFDDNARRYIVRKIW